MEIWNDWIKQGQKSNRKISDQLKDSRGRNRKTLRTQEVDAKGVRCLQIRIQRGNF